MTLKGCNNSNIIIVASAITCLLFIRTPPYTCWIDRLLNNFGMHKRSNQNKIWTHDTIVAIQLVLAVNNIPMLLFLDNVTDKAIHYSSYDCFVIASALYMFKTCRYIQNVRVRNVLMNKDTRPHANLPRHITPVFMCACRQWNCFKHFSGSKLTIYHCISSLTFFSFSGGSYGLERTKTGKWHFVVNGIT